MCLLYKSNNLHNMHVFEKSLEKEKFNPSSPCYIRSQIQFHIRIQSTYLIGLFKAVFIMAALLFLLLLFANAIKHRVGSALLAQ